MIGAMAGFAVSDAFIKVLTQTLPAGQILIVSGLLGFIFLFGIAHLKKRSLTGYFLRLPIFWMRLASDMFSATFIVAALVMTDLSLVSAVMQCSPLIAALLASRLLGESLSVTKVCAILVGLFGVLIILKPWSAEVEIGALLALLGSVSIALRDVLTRKMPKDIPSTVLITYGYLALAPGGLMVFLLKPEVSEISNQDAFLIFGAAVSGMIAYVMITISARTAEIVAIAPFRYSRLLFAMLIGVFIFGESLETSALVGASLVIGSGLYIFLQEAYKKQRLKSLKQ